MGIAEEMESPQCATCKWKDEFDFKCGAYPFGIPDYIVQNRLLHDKILVDQIGGFIYEGVE
jgi:hypothetical protein